MELDVLKLWQERIQRYFDEKHPGHGSEISVAYILEYSPTLENPVHIPTTGTVSGLVWSINKRFVYHYRRRVRNSTGTGWTAEEPDREKESHYISDVGIGYNLLKEIIPPEIIKFGFAGTRIVSCILMAEDLVGLNPVDERFGVGDRVYNSLGDVGEVISVHPSGLGMTVALGVDNSNYHRFRFTKLK